MPFYPSGFDRSKTLSGIHRECCRAGLDMRRGAAAQAGRSLPPQRDVSSASSLLSVRRWKPPPGRI